MPGRALIRDLERQVGVEHVLARPADTAVYAFDASGASGDRYLPDAVVMPASTAEVAGVVRTCLEHGVPVVPRGAGTGHCGGAVALTGGVVLCTVRMDSVVVDTASRTARAQAGAITAAVRRAAAAHGLHYPLEPASSSTSTIGGNVACNASAPQSLRYGSTGDHVVAATAVLADGRVEHLGGERGGEALLRLLIGSEGTLGVVTEATLRLVEPPARRVTLAAVFPGAGAAQLAVGEVASAGILPAAFEFMDSAALAAVARSGVGGGPLDPLLQQARSGIDEALCLVLVELEGDAAAVTAELDTVRAALARAGATETWDGADAATAETLWGVRRSISGAVASVMIGNVNQDVTVPRDRVEELLRRLRAIGAEQRVPVVTFGHLGEGALHCTLLIDPRRGGDRARADAAAQALLDTALDMDGVLTGEHGVGHTKLAQVEHQLGADGVALMRALKTALDPQGLFNPGKKVPGLSATYSAAREAEAEAALHA